MRRSRPLPYAKLPATAPARVLAIRACALARRHRLLAVLLVAGAVVRVLVEIAYRPALIFPDSSYYLHYAVHFTAPGDIRTTLYSDLIAPLTPLHALWLFPIAQHLLGLAAGVLGYAVLRRWGCPKWLAAIASAALLLDPLELILEHYILPDSLSVFLVLAVLAVLTWQPGRLSRRAARWTALLLAVSVLVKVQTVILAVPIAAYMLAVIRPRRLLLKRGIAMSCLLAVPLVAWAFWFHETRGPWALTDYTGRWLYGRVAQFADCTTLKLPADERPLCPAQPVSQRYQDFYMWNHHSPQWELRPPPGASAGTVAGAFALRVMAHQPLTFARVVGVDYVYGFAPVRHTGPERYPEQYLRFQPAFPVFSWHDTSKVLRTYGHTTAAVQPQAARILWWYGAVTTPGPLLPAAILAALAAAAGIGRARRSRLRPVCLLFGLTALLITVPDVAVSTFDWRYQLPQIVLAPLAGGLGVAALTGRGSAATAGTGAGQAAAAAVAREREAAATGGDAVSVPD